jgi:acetylornithine deacetylase/succinyl-diaminopimelate desuccinylase-like protein
MALDRNRFLETLGRLVALGDRLQNSVDAGKVPKESLAADVVLERLAAAVERGALRVERICAPETPERPNLVVTLPGRTPETLGFIGAHFDVVPADREAEGWTTPPFELVVESDGTLRGRGVTDCLGHVALLTELLCDLVAEGVTPKRTVVVVFISNEEESSVPGIGLDYVAARGGLECLAGGPVIWLDSADFGPTLGTGGIAAWELVATGVPGHSGMPHNCVNALELAMVASLELSAWFAKTYPPHPDEARWKYASSSSLKATVIDVDNQKVTKIPGRAIVRGDIRMTPFYDIDEAVAKARDFVESLNARIACAATGDPMARFRTVSAEVGHLRFVPKDQRTRGVACALTSPALTVLTQAIAEIAGTERLHPYSMTGSLPLVSDLEARGIDVQITGFGRGIGYHAPNESAHLADFDAGYGILRRLIEVL